MVFADVAVSATQKPRQPLRGQGNYSLSKPLTFSPPCCSAYTANSFRITAICTAFNGIHGAINLHHCGCMRGCSHMQTWRIKTIMAIFWVGVLPLTQRHGGREVNPREPLWQGQNKCGRTGFMVGVCRPYPPGITSGIFRRFANANCL